MKKTLALLCALAMVFALCACGQTAAPAAPAAPSASPEAAPEASPAAEAAPAAADDAKTFTVGVCQLVQHPALDAATQGFQDALN